MGNISEEAGKESQDVVVDSGITGDNRVAERVVDAVKDNENGTGRSIISDDKDNGDILGGSDWRGIGGTDDLLPNKGSDGAGRFGVQPAGVISQIVDYDKELPDHMGANQRFEIVIADPLTIEVVIQRVLDGESLKRIARSWKIPTLRFVKWVSDDAVRLASYEGALRIRADELIHETLEIAAAADDETVACDKLRIDTHIKVAAMWDRQRYGGEKGLGGAGITIVVNRGRYADEVAVNGETVSEVVGG